MTDATDFYRTVVTNTAAFVSAFENLKLISDRIGADSALSGQAATKAQTGGRTDLVAADFDNLKAFVDLVSALLNTTNGQGVTNNLNTGGKAVLAPYKMI